MIGFIALTGVVFVISAVSAYLDPSADSQRLRDARRELKRAGRRFEPGSESERHALLVLLEGGSVQDC
ncbi:MAG TPA: hypothetical protein VKA32_00705 [Gammaproteobacteria bacterium]|nr:hypothetical protein [Gammaproteobacteria bacterium]